MEQDPQQTSQRTGPAGQRQRRFGATRVLPRVEVGRAKPSAPLTPDVLEPGPRDEPQMGAPFGERDPFGPRTFAGGRVRLYGCSPGCLLASVLVSLILTLLLNALM